MHNKTTPAPDIGNVLGQPQAKSAILVAAAGRHNLLLLGPPGEGKSFLASTLPGITPPIQTADEWEELDATYRDAGQGGYRETRTRDPTGPIERFLDSLGILPAFYRQASYARNQRPYRAIGPTITLTSLIGGGRSQPIPGEFALANHGTLYIDELPQFPSPIINAMRQPLQDGIVRISRAGKCWEYPANVQLVASANPCPCGYWQPSGYRTADSLATRKQSSRCRCSPYVVSQYQRKLSGPIIDRIDLTCWLDSVNPSDLINPQPTPGDSAKLLIAVATCWAIARDRNPNGCHNANIPSWTIFACRSDVIRMETIAKHTLKDIVIRHGLSSRQVHKLVRVSRTIADLEQSETVTTSHVRLATELAISPFQRPILQPET